MVRYLEQIPYGNDELNIQKKRSINNTDKNSYNCAGYALGTYSWYIPYGEYDNVNLRNPSKKDYDLCIKTILNDFPNLEIVKIMLPVNKKIIAFRIGDGDFHFIVRHQKLWYEKIGKLDYLNRISKKEVFSPCWKGRYTGRIIFFIERED